MRAILATILLKIPGPYANPNKDSYLQRNYSLSVKCPWGTLQLTVSRNNGSISTTAKKQFELLASTTLSIVSKRNGLATTNELSDAKQSSTAVRNGPANSATFWCSSYCTFSNRIKILSSNAALGKFLRKWPIKQRLCHRIEGAQVIFTFGWFDWFRIKK